MKVYSYDYDFSYIPSAPFVEMTIASAFSTTPVSLNAFIDSGADATMIPFEVLQQLQAEEVETRYLRTVTGNEPSLILSCVGSDWSLSFSVNQSGRHRFQ